MTRCVLARSLALLACILLASTSLRAQLGTGQVQPLTEETTIALGETQWHDLAGPEVVVLGRREFLVTWDLAYQRYSGSQLVDWGSAISGRKVSLRGEPAGEELVLEPFEPRSYQGFHRLAADAAGRFVTLWHERDSSDLLLRLFAPDGDPLETASLEPGPGFVQYPQRPAVAMDRAGAISAAWTRREDVNRPPDELWMQLFAANLAPVRDSFQIRVPPQGANPPALALARGSSILADHFLVGGEILLAVQRFDARGQPLGRKIPVADGSTGRGGPAIAANAAGRFVVAWVDNLGIGARRFDASGRRAGPLIRVTRAAFAGPPDVAIDSRGNFVVIWQVETGPDGRIQIRTRLFNREGVPQGGENVVDPDLFSQAFSGIPPAVALSDAGTFLVSWATDVVEFTGEELLPGVLGRTYTVQRDDDRCVWRGGTFLCDTARDGNLNHQERRFGAPGDHPLLADFDGNGIDDPCVRRGGAFLCNTAEGEDPNLELRFGTAAQTPLAGDLDGDGDDDPCVRRGRAFLCDTAHDGGTAEVRILLGSPADEPLLGDVDGDGDDDPCLWRESTGSFLCDTGHDGAPDLNQAVGAPGPSRPLLGDVDGDGKDDFCFATPLGLLCDRDRDGELTEEAIDLEPEDWVVLGNVDGV